MKVGGIKTWKELTIGVRQLVRLLLQATFSLLLFADIFHLISSLRQSVVFFASFSCLVFIFIS